jgi:Restriction endonuclease S subunits
LPYAFHEKLADGTVRDITEELPFDVPENWEWVRLGSVLTKLTDGAHSTPRYTETGIPFLSVKDISSGKIRFDSSKYISEEEHRELYKRCDPQNGDILLTKVGTTGIPVLIDVDIEFSLFVSVALLKFLNQYINSNYLIYLLQSPLVQEQCNENTRGVGNKNWVIRDIADTMVIIPPLAEQHRIVERIEELLPHIAAYDTAEQKLTTLNATFPDALKKSILQAAVQGKLVPQDPTDEPASVLLERIRAEKVALIKAGKVKRDKHESVIFRRDNSHYEKVGEIERCIDDEIPFDVPETWAWARLGSVMNVVSARRVHQSDWKKSGIPFYRAREIVKLAEYGFVDNDLFISQELYNDFSKSGVPHENDLMVTAVGTIGKTYVVQPSDVFYYKDASVVCFENFSNIDASYMKLLMESPFMIEQIRDNSAGTTVDTITIIKANQYLLPIPPLAEQLRIVERIEKLTQNINAL